jgi:hypothetical protein
VRVAMRLIDVLAHPPRGPNEVDPRGDQWRSSRNTLPAIGRPARRAGA